jgi:hypothetical protein
MAETITLDLVGPRSPDYTTRVARAFAECVQVLNHATAAPDGIGHAGAAQDVLGSLHLAMAGLPQLFGQLGRWLQGARETGALAPAAEVAAAVVTVAEALDWAEIQIGTVTDSLDDARRALLGLHSPGGGGAGPAD